MMSVDSDDPSSALETPMSFCAQESHIFKSFAQKASKPTRLLITPYRCNRFRETNTCNRWYKNPKPSSQPSSSSVAVTLLIPFHSLCEITAPIQNPTPNILSVSMIYFLKMRNIIDSMMLYYCFYNVFVLDCFFG
jgi:hypothetical protein